MPVSNLGFPWWLSGKGICLPMQETWVWSLGWEDPLEKGMATHSSILAWSIPWTEEPGKLQYMASQRARYWAINTFTFTTKLSYFSSGEHILRFFTYLWKWETFAYVVLEYKLYFLNCVASSCEFALILHSFFFPLWSTISFLKSYPKFGNVMTIQ